MKKLFLLLLPAILFSCGGVEKHRSAIEEVAGEWSEITTNVTDFAEMVNSSTIAQNNKISSLMVPETEVEAMEPDTRTQWIDLRAQLMTQSEPFSLIQAELSKLMSEWGAKTTDLTSLTQGLEAGKIEGDVAAKLSELKDMANSATEKLAELKATYSESKSNIDSTIGSLAELHKSVKGE